MPPGPAGQEVEFAFVYNPDGILDITAKIPETGEEITFAADTGLDEGEIEKSREKLEKLWMESDYFEDVKALLRAAEDELESGLEPEKQKELQSLIEDIKQALAADRERQVHKLEEDITDFLFEIV